MHISIYIQQVEGTGHLHCNFLTAVWALPPTAGLVLMDRMEKGVMAHGRQGQNGHPRCCREGCWCYLSKPVSSSDSEQRRSGSGRERWPPTWSIIPSFHIHTSILLSPMTFLISQIQLVIFSPLSGFRLGLTAGKKTSVIVCLDTGKTFRDKFTALMQRFLLKKCGVRWKIYSFTSI